MTAYTWIKLYIEILDDPKVGLMPDWEFRRFIQFLLVARERNQGGLLGPVSELAWRLRSSEDDMLKSLRAMSEIGIVAETPDGWLVVNFAKRQAALTDAERSQQYRERHNTVTKRDEEPSRSESDDSISISSSFSDSLSSLKEGKQEKTKDAPALHIFTDVLGKLKGEAEVQRWLVIVDAVGKEQAQALVEWADKREIHLNNRAGLLNSLETAAKNWREKQHPEKHSQTVGSRADFLKKLAKA